MIRLSGTRLKQAASRRPLKRFPGELEKARSLLKISADKKIAERRKAGTALREISIIAEIGRITASTLEIDEVYESFCQEVGKLIAFDQLAVTLHDFREGLVRIAYIYGVEISGRAQGDSFPLPGSISEFVTLEKTGICRLPEGRIFNDCIAPVKKMTRSLMVVPLIHRNEVIASLHFRSKMAGVYDEAKLAVARRIGAQIAGAIANSLLYNNLKITEDLLKKSEELYRTFVKNANDIILRTDENGILRFVNPAVLRVTGYEEQEMIGLHYPQLISPDKREEAMRFFGIQFVKRIPNTYFELPIVKKGGGEIWLGQNVQLLVEDGRVTGFQAVSRDITDRRLAEEALRKSEEKYKELSYTDDLTRLYNSRYFYKALNMEVMRANRYNQPLTLLLVDIDNFKGFNDAYGHVDGDAVLARFGEVAGRSLRETDMAFRYGGEEFTIILPMTAKQEGAVTAERIRTGFADEDFAPSGADAVHVTVSIGVAQYRPQEECETFVRRADKLMYMGKKAGKNNVYVGP